MLVAPHHGSAGSSSAAFLAASSPQWVIYSAGFHNRFNFPRPAVIERVKVLGARQVSTGDRGAVHVRFVDGVPIAVSFERESRLRWWQEPSY